MVAVPRKETVIFIRKRLSINEILPHLAGVDFVILEGFEREKGVVKVIAAKTVDEVRSFLDESVIAVSGLIMESEPEIGKAAAFKIPMFRISTQTGELADLVAKKA